MGPTPFSRTSLHFPLCRTEGWQHMHSSLSVFLWEFGVQPNYHLSVQQRLNCPGHTTVSHWSPLSWLLSQIPTVYELRTCYFSTPTSRLPYCPHAQKNLPELAPTQAQNAVSLHTNTASYTLLQPDFQALAQHLLPLTNFQAILCEALRPLPNKDSLNHPR